MKAANEHYQEAAVGERQEVIVYDASLSLKPVYLEFQLLPGAPGAPGAGEWALEQEEEGFEQ